MGLFGNLVKKLVKNDYSLEAKEKCDFCDELFQKKPIKVITFSFTGDIQYQCCEKCFRKASKNDMRITSPQIVRDYITKEHIEHATDPRLKNFFGSQIYVDGMWITINSFMFFASSDIGLPMNRSSDTTNLSSSSNNLSQRSIAEDDSSFWTSFVVAELTHSPIAGYLVGGSFLGGLLGSSLSTSPDSFSTNDTFSKSSFDDSSSQSSFTSNNDSFSSSSWGDSSSDSSCSSSSDGGSSCGGGD